jgi:hypothetical protein
MRVVIMGNCPSLFNVYFLGRRQPDGIFLPQENDGLCYEHKINMMEHRTMKTFIIKTAFVMLIGLVLIGAHAAGRVYTERIAVQELSETFMVNCIPDDGGQALVKNEAGNVTCEKHEVLRYGEAPHG